ncbi:MAG TPA: metal-dependent transcriptional regulator [Chitinophagales bacterium]|nr:metal-dependent transcriptional regulator [Chitinophagales bacterium]
MASQTEENYLKALYHLSQEATDVNITSLSNLMEVSLPTVNSMVNNLKRQGLVSYEKYKPLSLTKKGQKEAALVLRKHRLTEMYLVDKMGFGWDEVHEIAEQIEHINSPAFFDRMDTLLGFPKIDPHGSPIPDMNGKVIKESYPKLSEFSVGSKVKLMALGHSSNEFLKFLTTRDLQLGVTLKIIAIESFDNSMTLKYKGHPTEIFSHTVCEKLLVEGVG